MSKKRGNNEGSITKRSDGRWMARVTVGRDPETGKLKRVSFYGKTREAVAGGSPVAEMLKQLASSPDPPEPEDPEDPLVHTSEALPPYIGTPAEFATDLQVFLEEPGIASLRFDPELGNETLFMAFQLSAVGEPILPDKIPTDALLLYVRMRWGPRWATPWKYDFSDKSLNEWHKAVEGSMTLRIRVHKGVGGTSRVTLNIPPLGGWDPFRERMVGWLKKQEKLEEEPTAEESKSDSGRPPWIEDVWAWAEVNIHKGDKDRVRPQWEKNLSPGREKVIADHRNSYRNAITVKRRGWEKDLQNLNKQGPLPRTIAELEKVIGKKEITPHSQNPLQTRVPR